MRKRLRSAGIAGRSIWWWLRQVTGDAAYENYLCWASQRGGTAAVRNPVPGSVVLGDAADTCRGLLSPERFYLDTLGRKYAGVSRCC